jgi:hypothetical protein
MGAGFGVQGPRLTIHGVGRVAEVDRSCRLWIVPLFHGSSRFGSFISSPHSRFTCECNKEEFNDDDDDARPSWIIGAGFEVQGPLSTISGFRVQRIRS